MWEEGGRGRREGRGEEKGGAFALRAKSPVFR